MFKMIYMLAQLKFELSSLWIQSARHVLLNSYLHASRAGFDWCLQSVDHEGLFALFLLHICRQNMHYASCQNGKLWVLFSNTYSKSGLWLKCLLFVLYHIIFIMILALISWIA